MHAHGRPGSSVRRFAGAATAAAILVAASVPTNGQTTPFSGPKCTAPPSPDTDGWPVAVTTTIGSTVSVKPITFTGGSLLTADKGTALRLKSIATTTQSGGTVTGTDPFTYIARPTFVGTDVFTYVIIDAYDQTTAGLAKVK